LTQATIQQDGLPTPQRYWAAGTIWLALTLSVLDGSIANVALPTIAADLNAPAADSVWVVNAYQLAIVISLLPMAAVGEMVGFRRVFQLGIIVFSLGSLGCSFAHSLPMLAFARAIQGFGAAGIMSQNGALVRFTYPSKMLGRGLGLNALVASAGAALGPTVASGILAVASWQWLFAVNVPIGIGAYLLGRRSLPDNPKFGAFDLAGTLLSASMFGFGFIGIDLLTRGGNIWVGISTLALGTGSAGALFLHSRSQAEPIVPIDLLKDPVFSLSVATSIASFGYRLQIHLNKDARIFTRNGHRLDQPLSGHRRRIRYPGRAGDLRWRGRCHPRRADKFLRTPSRSCERPAEPDGVLRLRPAVPGRLRLAEIAADRAQARPQNVVRRNQAAKPDLYGEHMLTDGNEMFAASCKLGFEGIRTPRRHIGRTATKAG
jgi:MFS family permease